jgi:3-oxoacyl-ACP reductase-like protein
LQDVEALVEYIYTDEKDKGLGLDLDYILPFAAMPENGRQIDGIDDKSELAHRIMLTNLLRLLGAVKTKKASRRFITRPTQVVLPLSPNHGLFGSDGLYSESKISLETLFNRWSSESWGDYLCIAGAVIGKCDSAGLGFGLNLMLALLFLRTRLDSGVSSSSELFIQITVVDGAPLQYWSHGAEQHRRRGP